MGDLLECSVCLDEFSQPHMLPGCGHTFCLECILAMPQAIITFANLNQKKCPLCRTPFEPSRVCPNYVLQHMLDAGSAGAPAPAAPNRASHGAARPIATADAYERLGVPPAFASELAQTDAGIALRVYLLDNSGSMQAGDGNILTLDAGGRRQLLPATRWGELAAMVAEQASWNQYLGVPCQFQLLNSPSPQAPQEGMDIFHVDARLGDTSAQVQMLNSTMSRLQPNNTTPLGARLGDIRRRLLRDGAELARAGLKIELVIATDGVPNEPRHEFVAALRRIMTELPISIVIRLCTDESNVADFYNEVDKDVEMPLDIIDDLRGEANHVYQSNPWLAYSPLLQSVRIAGTSTKVFDFVDERALAPMEVAICAQLLVRQAGMPPYSRHPKEFLEELERDLPGAEVVFDARTGRMIPPIDIEKLKAAVYPSMFGGAAGFLRGFGLGGLLDAFDAPSKRVRAPQAPPPPSQAAPAPMAAPMVVTPVPVELDYYSYSQNAWFNCEVTNVNADGAVEINLKPGVWFTCEQRGQFFRPRSEGLIAAAAPAAVQAQPSVAAVAPPGVVPGARMEYYSESKKEWFQCTILSVDAATGAVTIDLKPQQPLAAELAKTCLRPLASSAVVGAKMEYWSERQQQWFPCTVTHVDPATNAVTLDLKRSNPLSPDQAQALLRPAGSNPPQPTVALEQISASAAPGQSFAQKFPGIVPGDAIEYYSERQHGWFPCNLVSVDPTTGAVEIDLKPGAPLSASQVRTCLRLPGGGPGTSSTLLDNPMVTITIPRPPSAMPVSVATAGAPLAMSAAQDIAPSPEVALTPEQERAKVFAEAFVEEHKAQLREIFDKCDTNGDGHVTKFELAMQLRNSEEVSKVLEDGRVKESLEAIIENLNKESGRKITWPEFGDLFCVSLQALEVAALA